MNRRNDCNATFKTDGRVLCSVCLTPISSISENMQTVTRAKWSTGMPAPQKTHLCMIIRLCMCSHILVVEIPMRLRHDTVPVCHLWPFSFYFPKSSWQKLSWGALDNWILPLITDWRVLCSVCLTPISSISENVQTVTLPKTSLSMPAQQKYICVW